MTKPDHDNAKFYIDEYINIYEGKEAARRLNDHSDRAFVDPQTGITKVDALRWQEAQRYERRTWMEHGKYTLSDRNEYHLAHFANYGPLRGASFQRGIELGCGPFTNMRLILDHCRVQNLHLLDPLICDYLAHPSCRYRGGKMGGLTNSSLSQIPAAVRHPLQFVRTMLNAYRIGGFSGRPVVIEQSKIEDFQTTHQFDLVVMINVIEHCQDVNAIFNKILQIIPQGGTFVFHDVLYDASEVSQTLSVSYDAGHPLRVDQALVHRFLEDHFEPSMHAQYWIDQEFCGHKLPRQEIYYVGKRRTKAR